MRADITPNRAGVVVVAEAVAFHGRPGPITQRILAAYHEYVAGAVRTGVFE